MKRSADSLRENLRRRKAQARARRDAAEGDSGEGAGGCASIIAEPTGKEPGDKPGGCN